MLAYRAQEGRDKFRQEVGIRGFSGVKYSKTKGIHTKPLQVEPIMR